MPCDESRMNRRKMIRMLGLGAAAAGLGRSINAMSAGNSFLFDPLQAAPAPMVTDIAEVSLIRGNDCRDNTFTALLRLEDQIMVSLEGKKRILIKPNFVSTSVPLCATHVEAVRGILDFFRPRWDGPIVVGESTASRAGTGTGFKNYGYLPLEKEYGVILKDLNEGPSVDRYVFGPENAPLRVPILATFLEKDQYIVSAAKMKTHDRTLTTLSLKNILLAAPLNHYGKHNYKANMHPRGLPAFTKDTVLHYNMFALAREIWPDLSVIDGFEAMEGNGPTGGTPVDARLAMASLDPLALDSLCTRIMGFDPAEVLYLSSMKKAGMGQGDLAKIRTLGTDPAELNFKFRPHDKLLETYGFV